MAARLSISIPDFEVDSIKSTFEHILITAHSIQLKCHCPECGQAGRRIHSWYTRQPMDVPCMGQVVRLTLSVRRFFCDNSGCGRCTFAEQFKPWLRPYARRTERLLLQVKLLALSSSGEGSQRLSRRLGFPTSASTFIRHIRRQAFEAVATPRVLGVDDWAMKKGKRYGTILIDLEAHRPVDVLADREPETFAAWLRAHPGVEIISRDRGSAYIEGATKGAPQAIQVADRWHLLHNLRETVQEILEPLRAQLTILGEQVPAKSSETDSSAVPKKRAWAHNREVRFARYQKMVELAAQGLDNDAIAQVVGVSNATVRKYLAAGEFLEWQPRPVVSKWLQPYLAYIQQRWDEGCHNSAQLWRELCQQGYTRSRTLLYEYVSRLRNGLPTTPEPVCTPRFSVIRRYSPREASWLLVSQRHTLEAQQRQDLTSLRQRCPELEQAYQLAQAFYTMIRERQVDALQPWMRQALESALAPLRKFVFGLHRDLKAVRAALTLPWSNGQTEGQVNRLKLIKRQMYGRANFDLLRLRVLQTV